MKLFNYIFYIVLFVGFFLPTNTNFYIPFPGILLSVSELAFLLLPVINIFCTSKNGVRIRDKKLIRQIVLFLGVILFTEIVVKRFVYSQGLEDAFKAIRVGVPLFSCLILILQGIRVNIRVVWKIVLVAVIASVVLSLLSLVMYLPIYYDLENGENLLRSGRIANSNAPFGIIGLYLLFEDKDKWYNQGKLVKIAAVLSVVSLLLTFNRTYLALLTLEGVYLVYKHFSAKQIVRGVFFCTVFFFVGYYAYHTNNQIQRQVDKRIISILTDETSIAESTIEGNRDTIYEGIARRIDQGYWVMGLPFDMPIFTWAARYDRESRDMTTTDTSFINVLLRYGFIPFGLWFVILRRAFWKVPFKFVRNIFIIFALISLNADTLLRHNSIFFLTIILFISLFRYEKNLFRNKN